MAALAVLALAGAVSAWAQQAPPARTTVARAGFVAARAARGREERPPDTRGRFHHGAQPPRRGLIFLGDAAIVRIFSQLLQTPDAVQNDAGLGSGGPKPIRFGLKVGF